MRFGLVHRIMTDALAALGVFALVASGQFTRSVNIVVTILVILAVSMKESWRHEAANKHADTIGVVALVAAQLGRAMFTNASVLDLLIEFAVGLQIIRVATRKGAAHDQQVIVLALLHLIAGTVVGGGLGYGLCFFGLLVVTPGALVLSHLRREVEGNYRQGARDRTGLPVDVPRILRSKRVVGRQFIAVTCLLSVPILLFTVSLFIIFPRVGLSLLLLNRPKNGRVIGFSGKVDLGQIGTLRSDPTIALRVTIPNQETPPPLRKAMHLRGTALDHYDGRSWSQSTKHSRTVATGSELVPLYMIPRPGVDPMMRIDLEPIDPPVLFLPPDAKGFRLNVGVSVGPGTTVQVLRASEGEYRYQAPNDRGVQYEVYRHPEGQAAFPHLRASDRGRYLQLPEVSQRIRNLGEEWAGAETTDFSKAKAIETHLRTEFEYDLSSPSGEADEPLDHFLFESKAGHCEYYSTAMAVLLRTVNIPSRNVTGFIGGTYNRYGEFYAVRQGDAHSWVEAYIEGRGWLTFDPTPPGEALPQSDIDGMLVSVRDFFEAVSQRWNQHVLNYDLRQQVSLFERLSNRSRGPGDIFGRPTLRTWLFLLGVIVALASARWWQKMRRRAKEAERAPDGRKRSRHETLATNLYEALDRVMSLVGIARSNATPPLRHARFLLEMGHPLGDEVMALTERYLSARYGDALLSAEERRDFETRVKKLKDAPRVPFQAAAFEPTTPPVDRPFDRAPEPPPSLDESEVEISTAPAPLDSEAELGELSPPSSS